MRGLLLALICFCLAIAWVSAQSPSPSITPSYLPAVGRTFNYRLVVNGEVQAEMAGTVGFAHFAATVEIEQKWQRSGNRLRCDLTVKGGTLRVFSSAGERTEKLGWTRVTFLTTPNGEIVDLMGGGARSFDELVGNFDLMATAMATLILPFPKEGLKIGDAWQGAHQLGPTITLTTVQCVEQPTSLPPRFQPLKFRLRYLLPIDALIDPAFRAQTNFTARYSAESEVLFSVAEGRTISASGTIRLEVGTKLPIPQQLTQQTEPEQSNQNQPNGQNAGQGREQQEINQNQSEQQQGQNKEQQQNQTTTTVTPSLQLKVDAKFDLLTMQ
ncbi:MAG: hypothetical protein N3B10_03125 [Armatimonadetes bacterium]|nr:hypothetical protein [Armatimonadota bacterium]MCX7967464.1 hypothetical protein [Armatimonadota bacterium]MDW8143744.1 hypothetical protein [Armatimonadota bacterium]